MDEPPVIPNRMWQLRMYRYHRRRGSWKHVVPGDNDSVEKKRQMDMTIITWNVNYDSGHRRERMQVALLYLERNLFQDQEPEPTCIMFQEVHVEMLSAIKEQEWVRKYFQMTPCDAKKWPNGSVYGNVTLVSRSLEVVNAQLLEYGSSAQSRTALITDVVLESRTKEQAVIRVINTHLESLEIGRVARPLQLKLCAQLLKSSKDIVGGFVAGDMNTICPEDAPLAKSCGLRDAWRQPEDDPEGLTWGFQGGGDYPKSRLDRIFFVPSKRYLVNEPETIGVGLKYETDWVSDHYGLVSALEIVT